MKLKLIRNVFTNNSTIGDLYINDKFFGYILEDKVRAFKIKHETAIPVGTYQIDITYSPKFKRLMPRLLNVPNYNGILIHTGNDADDTSGCLLVGLSKGIDRIGESRKAFNELFSILKVIHDSGEPITIEISNNQKKK